MTFTLTIELGNDAMQTGEHLAEVLRQVAEVLQSEDTLEHESGYGHVQDANGNTCGKWEITS